MNKDKGRFLLLIVPLSDFAHFSISQILSMERVAIFVPEWSEFFLMKFMKKTGLNSCIQYRTTYPRSDGALYLFDVLDYG